MEGICKPDINHIENFTVRYFWKIVCGEFHKSQCYTVQYRWNKQLFSVLFDHTFENIFQLISRVVILISILQLFNRRGEKVSTNLVFLLIFTHEHLWYIKSDFIDPKIN